MPTPPRPTNPADDANAWPDGVPFRNGQNWALSRRPRPGDRPCLYVLPSAAIVGPLVGAFKVGVTVALRERHLDLARMFGAFDLARAYVVRGRSRADIGLLEDLVNTRFGMARQWKPTIFSSEAGNLHHVLEPGPGLRMNLDQRGNGCREWLNGCCWEATRTFVGTVVQLMGLEPDKPRPRLWLREDLRSAIHGRGVVFTDSHDSIIVAPWPIPLNGHPQLSTPMPENAEVFGSDAALTSPQPLDGEKAARWSAEIKEQLDVLHWRAQEADTRDLLLRIKWLEPFIDAILWSLQSELEELEPDSFPPDEEGVCVAVLVRAGPWCDRDEDRAQLSGLLGNRVPPASSPAGYPKLSGVGWTPQRVTDANGQLVGWVDQANLEINLPPISECSPATARLRRGLAALTRQLWAREEDH